MKLFVPFLLLFLCLFSYGQDVLQYNTSQGVRAIGYFEIQHIASRAGGSTIFTRFATNGLASTETIAQLKAKSCGELVQITTIENGVILIPTCGISALTPRAGGGTIVQMFNNQARQYSASQSLNAIMTEVLACQNGSGGGGGGSLGNANNGLYVTPTGIVRMGGDLIENTVVALKAFSFTFDNADQFSIKGLPFATTDMAYNLAQDETGRVYRTPNFEGVIEFSGNVNPNQPGVTFIPDLQQQTKVVYISLENGGTWVWNGTQYITIETSSLSNFWLANTTTDAGGNKMNAIYRLGRTGFGINNPQNRVSIMGLWDEASGLQFPMMTSATPAGTSTAYLAVDQWGNVVRAADPQSGGGAVTAENGLTASSNTVRLGGNLNQATTIGIGNQSLSITGSDNLQLQGIPSASNTNATLKNLSYNTANGKLYWALDEENFVEFNTTNPNTGSPTFTPNMPQNLTVVYGSSVDGSTWAWDGNTYVQYIPPARTPFFRAGTTVDIGNNKVQPMYRNGNIGVRTNNPTHELHLNPTANNTSGLRLEKLTSGSPNGSSTAYLAVDGNGVVVRGAAVDGSTTNEGVLGVDAGTATTSVITSNTGSANGVTISAGTGISLSETTSANGGTITITNSSPNINQTLSASSNTLTLSDGGGSVTIAGGGINTVSTSGSTITITGTEVDGSVTNELQTLNLSSNILSISDGNSVSLSSLIKPSIYTDDFTFTGPRTAVFESGNSLGLTFVPNSLFVGSNLQKATQTRINRQGIQFSYPAYFGSASNPHLEISNLGLTYLNGGYLETQIDFGHDFYMDPLYSNIFGIDYGFISGDTKNKYMFPRRSGTPGQVIKIRDQYYHTATNTMYNDLVWADDNSGGGGGSYTAGTGISINGSNVISNTGDLSDNNEIQTITLTGDDVNLSLGGGSISLAPYKVDTHIGNADLQFTGNRTHDMNSNTMIFQDVGSIFFLKDNGIVEIEPTGGIIRLNSDVSGAIISPSSISVSTNAIGEGTLRYEAMFDPESLIWGPQTATTTLRSVPNVTATITLPTPQAETETIELNPMGEMITVFKSAANVPKVETISSSATQTAVAGYINQVDCTNNTVIISAPQSPYIGMVFAVVDSRTNAHINNIIVTFNGLPLYGSVQDFVLNVKGGYAEFVYMGQDTGWICKK